MLELEQKRASEDETKTYSYEGLPTALPPASFFEEMNVTTDDEAATRQEIQLSGGGGGNESDNDNTQALDLLPPCEGGTEDDSLDNAIADAEALMKDGLEDPLEMRNMDCDSEELEKQVGSQNSKGTCSPPLEEGSDSEVICLGSPQPSSMECQNDASLSSSSFEPSESSKNNKSENDSEEQNATSSKEEMQPSSHPPPQVLNKETNNEVKSEPPKPRQRYRIPLRSVKILFGRCEVRLWRCDDLINGSRIKTRRKPGPKSKTRILNERPKRLLQRPGPKSRTKVEPQPVSVSKKPGPKSKTQPRPNQKQPKMGPKSRTQRKKGRDDSDKEEIVPSTVTARRIAKRLIKKKHGNEGGQKVIKCSQCPETFTKHIAYLGHIRSHRGKNFSKNKWNYACSTCGKKCNTSAALRIHVRTHTGEKPYKCKTCGKGFLTSGNLKSHWRIHTGEKPYECNTCANYVHGSLVTTISVRRTKTLPTAARARKVKAAEFESHLYDDAQQICSGFENNCNRENPLTIVKIMCG